MCSWVILERQRKIKDVNESAPMLHDMKLREDRDKVSCEKE